MAVTNSQALSWVIQPFLLQVGGSQSVVWTIGISDETIQVVLEGAPTGMVGVLTVSIITFDGSVVIYAATTIGIAEVPADTGRYVATIPKPNIGHYWIIWSDGTTTAPVELMVLPDSVVQTPIRATGFSEYAIKAGDLEPSLLLVLRNAGGDPIDLSGAVGVDIKVRAKDSPEAVVEREVMILDPPDEGQVVLDWLAGETDLPGTYIAEASILWPSNGRSTAPSKASYRFLIEEGSV